MGIKKPPKKRTQFFEVGNGLYREFIEFPKESEYPVVVPAGEHLYRVIFVDKIKDCLGMCSPKEKLIMIARNQEPGEMYSTFFHECAHAWQAELGIKISHADIHKLEYAIVAVLMQFHRGGAP